MSLGNVAVESRFLFWGNQPMNGFLQFFSAGRQSFNSETFKDLFVHFRLLISVHYAQINQMWSYYIVVNGALFPEYRPAVCFR